MHGQQVITQWTFNGTTQPQIGEGTAALIGGTVQVDLDQRWRMVGFPDQFEDSGTAGASFMTGTEGFEHIRLTYGHRSSGTQSRWAEVHYTLDGGNSWEVLGNNEGGLSPHDEIYQFAFSLENIPGAADNPDFGIRIVSIFSPVPFNPEEPDEDFEADTAYHRARTEGTGGNPYAGGEDGGNWRLHDVTILGDPIDDDDDIDRELIHFMVFDASLPNDTPFEMLMFTYSFLESGMLYFHSALDGYPYNEGHPLWRKSSMERRNAPTPINYLPEGNYDIAYEDADMRGLQVRQPFAVGDLENTLEFHLPVNLHDDVLFGFAAKDEGAADRLIVDYSVSPGDPQWISDGLAQTEYTLLSTYQHYMIDFKDIPGVANNPHFRVRIRFDGDDMSADDGDRVTFNNISLHANLMDDVAVADQDQENFLRISPNPASDMVHIRVADPVTNIRVFDMHGVSVFEGTARSGHLNIDVTGFAPGIYVIHGKSASGQKSGTARLLVQ